MTEIRVKGRFSQGIAWLDELDQGDVPCVGGKCASLAAMVRDGMRVPDGFVVTTDAYEEFMARAGLDSEARAGRAALDRRDAAAVAEWSARMTERLESSPLPAQLDQAIRGAYQELCRRCADDDVPVAVRSSGVAEDLEGASFAGQYETYLWITGADAVVQHVKRCWAGLFGAPVLTYEPTAEAEAAGAEMPAMAVGVQRMVDARAAGVMLTLDPLNGDRSKIVIEGSWGLGEAVVSGEVTPDRFRLDKITRAVEQEIAVKEREYAHDGCGLVIRAVPDERREQPCLEASTVGQLAELGRDLERRRGAPQDIEWAVAQDGVVHVLQARPETIWSARRTSATAASGGSALDLVLQQLTGGRA